MEGHQHCHSNEMTLRDLAHDHKQRDGGWGQQCGCDCVEADNVFYTIYLCTLAQHWTHLKCSFFCSNLEVTWDISILCYHYRNQLPKWLSMLCFK